MGGDVCPIFLDVSLNPMRTCALGCHRQKHRHQNDSDKGNFHTKLRGGKLIATRSRTCLLIELPIGICARVRSHPRRRLDSFVPSTTVGVTLNLRSVAKCLTGLVPSAAGRSVTTLHLRGVSVLLHVVVVPACVGAGVSGAAAVAGSLA